MCDYDDGTRADDPILPGHRYVRVGTLFEGAWSTIKVHEQCHDLTKYVAFDCCGQHNYYLDDPDATLLERVREHYDEHPELLRMYAACVRARRGLRTTTTGGE